MIATSPVEQPDAAPTPGIAGQSATVRELGALLRMAFVALETAPLPARLQELLDRLGNDTLPVDTSAVIPASTLIAGQTDSSGPLGDTEFKAALANALPHLRAYGRSLSGSADLADDLVQETMLKAWTARDRFLAGSSMRAWTHVILRNVYFSLARRARFRGEWDEFSADLLLAVPPAQEGHVALGDMQRALMQLPAEQREALILMGASGLSCEEVAVISQCAVGTVKSRVARARAALRALLDGGQLKSSRAEFAASQVSALDQIMQQAQQLASGKPAELSQTR